MVYANSAQQRANRKWRWGPDKKCLDCPRLITARADRCPPCDTKIKIEYWRIVNGERARIKEVNRKPKSNAGIARQKVARGKIEAEIKELFGPFFAERGANL